MLLYHLYRVPFPTKEKTVGLFTSEFLVLSNSPGAVAAGKIHRRLHIITE